MFFSYRRKTPREAMSPLRKVAHCRRTTSPEGTPSASKAYANKMVFTSRRKAALCQRMASLEGTSSVSEPYANKTLFTSRRKAALCRRTASLEGTSSVSEPYANKNTFHFPTEDTAGNDVSRERQPFADGQRPSKGLRPFPNPIQTKHFSLPDGRHRWKRCLPRKAALCRRTTSLEGTPSVSEAYVNKTLFTSRRKAALCWRTTSLEGTSSVSEPYANKTLFTSRRKTPLEAMSPEKGSPLQTDNVPRRGAVRFWSLCKQNGFSLPDGRHRGKRCLP